MGEGQKTLLEGKLLAVALIALLLAVGFAACGGDDSTDSTAAEAGQGSTETTPGAAQKGKAKSGEGGKSTPGKAKEAQPAGKGPSASEFVPRHHHDSGGGSQQFRVKGGDNSVQEFGAEAGSSERDEAAVVLHDFLDARAESNWAAACQYLAKSVVQSLEELASKSHAKSTSCGAILGQLMNPNAQQLMKEEAESADVGSLRIEGEQAFVIYTGTEGTTFAVPMKNEGGHWKVGSLAGTALD